MRGIGGEGVCAVWGDESLSLGMNSVHVNDQRTCMFRNVTNSAALICLKQKETSGLSNDLVFI